MSREGLDGEVEWKSSLHKCVQSYKMCILDMSNEFLLVWLLIGFQNKMDDWIHNLDKNDVSVRNSEESRNVIMSSWGKLGYPVAVRWEQAQTWWLIFSHSGLPLCKLHSRVNRHIDRAVSGEVEHKGENKTWVHEGKSLIGKFERKGELQAVWDTSRENKGSERLRQTQQTGTLPGVFQPNVFKCILLITKL